MAGDMVRSLASTIPATSDWARVTICLSRGSGSASQRSSMDSGPAGASEFLVFISLKRWSPAIAPVSDSLSRVSTEQEDASPQIPSKADIGIPGRFKPISRHFLSAKAAAFFSFSVSNLSAGPRPASMTRRTGSLPAGAYKTATSPVLP